MATLKKMKVWFIIIQIYTKFITEYRRWITSQYGAYIVYSVMGKQVMEDNKKWTENMGSIKI